MKLLTMLCAASLLTAIGCSTKSTTETMVVANKENSGAIMTCRTLVNKVIDKDFKAVQELSLKPNMPKHKKLSKKGFNEMHEEHLAELKDLECLREMVSEDHAVVEAESEGNKRLIPFVNTDTGWKFDSGAYMAFYNYGSKKHKHKH